MQSTLGVSKSSIFLSGFLLFAQFLNGFHAAAGASSDASAAWFALAFYWAVAWWFINDSRQQGVNWVDDYMDMGMFLYIAGIFLVPYYLFKSRGWKAIITIGLFLGVYLGAYLAGVVLHSLMNNS
jgi:hypothetical protein